MSRIKNRKGQLEVFGLVIIVILIMLGLVFVIRFIILPEQAPIRENYLRTQLAANMINSLLSTTTEDCWKVEMKDLIIDCYDKGGTEDVMICENGVNSCQYLNDTLEKRIFNSTLNIWQKKYDFVICEWSDPNMACEPGTTISRFRNPNLGGCDDNSMNIEVKQSPIPVNMMERDVRIMICE